MTNDSRRRFKRLRDDPEAPILVQNMTDALIQWEVYRDQRGSDWKVDIDHRNRNWRSLRIEPGEIVNLRELIIDEAFHSNMTIPWLIDTGRIMVLNDHYGNTPDPYEDEEIQHILEAMKNPPPQRTARYYAIQAQRSRNERRHPR
jgi:hypothetical protein